MNRTRKLTILGSTGSIGVNTLDVISRHKDKYEIVALTANNRIDVLIKQCEQFRPKFAVVADARKAEEFDKKIRQLGIECNVLCGQDGLCTVASLDEIDTVMAAIVGAAGLSPTMAAARSGKKILLANKEALVMAGSIFLQTAKQHNAVLLPIDSEHNAIFQALPLSYNGSLTDSGIKKILLTASGGPFRTTPREKLERVTPHEACAHPNWDMGKKISVDSATMMNKGLEVIEARWLFNAPYDKIQVVIHPQSIIHSLVEYIDGSVIAQLGNPDMRTPIAYALAFPDRIESGVASLDLFKIGTLNFEAPDLVRFPCLALAYQALHQGGNAPAVLNAANEIAVASFLEEKISFVQIPQLIEYVLSEHKNAAITSLDDVFKADAGSRELAAVWLKTHSAVTV
jgi:1-deoxy-D-xylulose-5-phosphate reductoisomerase